jgi:hypothetical protein
VAADIANHVQSETGVILSETMYKAPDDEGIAAREVLSS